MTDDMTGHNGDERLRALFDRIISERTRERESKEALKEIYDEAKSAGYDVPALRETEKRYWVAQDDQKKRRQSDKEDLVEVYSTQLRLF